MDEMGMLPRVLEPEVMDTAVEAIDYDSMDHSQVNQVFVDDFLAVWDGVGPVMDLGTGTAQIPVELCRRDSRICVVAVDLAEEMLKIARRNVASAGLSDRIRLERVDAKHSTFSDGEFPALMSNSIVHHIPEPRRVFAEMVRLVRPGGVLFVRDLLRPDDDAEVRRLVAAYAGNANDHQKQMFEDSLRAALTLDEVRDLVAACGHDPAHVVPTSDRHWTWATRRR